jgi:hypothetical protein
MTGTLQVARPSTLSRSRREKQDDDSDEHRDIRDVEDAGPERPETEAHEVRHGAAMHETIDPVREPASRDQAQADERTAGQGTRAEEEDADQEETEGNDGEEEEAADRRGQALAEAQEAAGVEGELEADCIRCERDSGRFREHFAGELFRRVVAPRGSEKRHHEEQDPAPRHGGLPPSPSGYCGSESSMECQGASIRALLH